MRHNAHPPCGKSSNAKCAVSTSRNPRHWHSGDPQTNAIDRREPGEVERRPVVIAPIHVDWHILAEDRAYMFTSGIQHPNPTRTGAVNIALGIDLHAVRPAAPRI